MNKKINLTKLSAERIIPEIDNGGSYFYEHIARYLFACPLVKGKVVLDAGCGMGYGGYVFAKYGRAKKVISVDISKSAIQYAVSKYVLPNNRYTVDNIETLNTLSDKEIDIAVSFEVIEHLNDQESFLKQIKRVVKKKGIFIVSTPNKLTYPAGNPFHKRELYPEEFFNLLKRYYKKVVVFEQKFDLSQQIKGKEVSKVELEDRFLLCNQASYNVDNNQKTAEYLVAVCSDLPIAELAGVSINLSKLNNIDLNGGIIDIDKKLTDYSNLQDINKELTRRNYVLESELNGIRLSKLYKLWPIYCKIRRYYLVTYKGIKLIVRKPQRLGIIFVDLISGGPSKLLQHLKQYEITSKAVAECKLWMEKHFPSEQMLEDEKQEIIEFDYKPKFSLITPTYNTPLYFLKYCIESVLDQNYSNWELCIADDASKSKEVRDLIVEYAKKDKRIKYVFRKENGQISKASNSAIELATGDFIITLDHDDTLAPNALFEIAKTLNKNKQADFLYSDYAIMDEDNRVTRLGFCPDFSRYYYLSHPYIVHLIAIRTSIIKKINGFDDRNFNAGVSHDVDLLLRVFAQIEDKKIIHISKILYFWRQYNSSTGYKLQEKVAFYTKKAITKYLRSMRIKGQVKEGLAFNTFRIRPELDHLPQVSIIIPTKDKWKLLKNCIGSIEKKAGYSKYEIIVVKNNTKDKNAINYLKHISKKYLVLNFPYEFNYSKINNYACKYAKGELVLLLNDDIEFITPDFIKSMVEVFQFKEVGVVGAKLLYPDNKIQHAGVILGMNKAAEHWHKSMNAYMDKKSSIFEPGYISSLLAMREFSAVTGACLMTRRDMFDSLNGLSEDLKVGFGDVDYCLRVREKGYKVIFTPYAIAYHYEHASRLEEKDDKIMTHTDDLNLFLFRWRSAINRGDPYYNHNLSLYSVIPIPSMDM